MQICPHNSVNGCTYRHNSLCTTLITLKSLYTIVGTVRRILLNSLRWTHWMKDYSQLHKQHCHEKKLSLHILEVEVSEYCHTRIWWKKLSGNHKPMSVEQEAKVPWWEQAQFCLSHAFLVFFCLYALVKLRPVLIPWSLQCRKEHKENMEGLWQEISGNFREMHLKPFLLYYYFSSQHWNRLNRSVHLPHILPNFSVNLWKFVKFVCMFCSANMAHFMVALQFLLILYNIYNIYIIYYIYYILYILLAAQ